jgi:hypothetical protein
VKFSIAEIFPGVSLGQSRVPCNVKHKGHNI